MFTTILTAIVFFELASAGEVPVCGLNEEFKECGSECEATCISLFEPRVCSDVCVRGCFCQEGFVRGQNGDCIPVRSCGNVPKCPPNEVYASCATTCPVTCQNWTPEACVEICVDGCVCEEGFVRSSLGGPCVPKEICNLAVCGANQVYRECGSACPGTCFHPSRVCAPVCVPGCFCMPGFVLDDRSLECVSSKHCPRLIS